MIRLWIKEINEYLVLFLREKLKVHNGKELAPVKVTFSSPEGEGEKDIHENLPIVAVSLVNVLPDFGRIKAYHGMQDRVDINEDEVEIMDYPEPYWLYYKFSFTTGYNEDVMDLTTQLFRIFGNRGFVKIIDGEGEVNPLYMEFVGFNSPDRSEKEKTLSEERKTRIFRTEMIFKITAELQRSDAQRFYKTKDVPSSEIEGGD